MGDAFVDAWSVANKVSDLLLERMGREVRRRTKGQSTEILLICISTYTYVSRLNS